MKRLLHSSLSASFLTLLLITCSHFSQASGGKNTLLAQAQVCADGVSPEYCLCAAEAEANYNQQGDNLAEDAKEAEKWRVWREYTLNLQQCHRFLSSGEREAVYRDECLTQFSDLPNPEQYCSCQVALDLDVENTFRQGNVNVSAELFQEFGQRKIICASYLHTQP
ncbi:hypothetical protein [Spirulina subsalsa]|uniref:hypothetical protein n=1 Tax=Spirulina subsalsa TaxID=54311 RepID=UPI0002D71A1C|nr:hypothetical protein [Spirulina subsalsa]